MFTDSGSCQRMYAAQGYHAPRPTERLAGLCELAVGESSPLPYVIAPAEEVDIIDRLH